MICRPDLSWRREDGKSTAHGTVRCVLAVVNEERDDQRSESHTLYVRSKLTRKGSNRNGECDIRGSVGGENW